MHFRSHSEARRQQLKADLSAFTMGPKENIAAYVARARLLASELRDLDTSTSDLEVRQAIAEADTVRAMLNGLPSAYRVLERILTHSYAGPRTFDALLPILLDEEVNHTKRGGASALWAAPSGSAPGTNSSPFCRYCKKKGHVITDCFKKKAADERKAKEGKPAPGVTAPPKSVALMASPAVTPDNWVIDSGASHHLTCNAALLEDLKPLPTPIDIQFGDGQVATAVALGTAHLHSTDRNGDPVNIMLTDVRYVPAATVSLLSVAAAEERGATVTFAGGVCFISMGKDIILEAPRSDGLYIVPGHPVAHPASVEAGYITVQPPEETPELWHSRLGHVGYRKLAKVLDMVDGINLPPKTLADFKAPACEPCILGKQDRRPFTSSETATTQPMQLVHADVVGPIALPALDTARYVLTVLDDYSGFTVVETVATKAAVPGVLAVVLSMLETMSGKQLQILRTDRGTEFVNNEVTHLLQQRGARHQTSVPYTPQQNGKAERHNRTLVERARTSILATDLPYSLWGEAIECAAYLHNRLPTAKRDRTPLELFTGERPDISHLRTWGCKGWAKLLVGREGKFHALAVPCRMVGYSLNSKAYRLYLPDRQQVIDHRDVLFDEKAPLKTGAKPEEPVAWEHITDPFYKLEASPPLTHRVDDIPEDPPAPDHEEVGLSVVPVAEDGPVETSTAESSAPPPHPPSSPPELAGSITDADGMRRSARHVTAAEHAHAAFSGDITVPPSSFAEAMSRPDSEFWRLAMEEEMASQRGNGTWIVVKRPPEVKTLPVRWVYTCKKDSRGNIVRYKARLVAKGFKQREGVDYSEVFAPVSKHASLRSLLAVVAQRNLELHQLDVKTAFLNGELAEEIFIEQPPGYSVDGSGHVCLLLKALYGLKQAPRVWYETLRTKLEELGFKASSADTSLFIRDDCTLLVYVDDILIAAPKLETVNSIKTTLGKLFDVRDLGEARFFLGMEIERDRAKGTLRLSQRALAESLIAKFGMTQSKPKRTPMDLSVRLIKSTDPAELCGPDDTHTYMEIVGSLLYLSTCTRPDIAQAVGVLSRFMSCPTPVHLSAAKGVLRYLVGSPALGILYHASTPEFELTGYCDADYAGDLSTRRSTAGFVFLLCGGAITWVSRMQPTVAASTTEAEYMAASIITKEALWLRNLLCDLGMSVSGPLPVKCDNQAALHLIKQPVVSSRAKHIDVMHHFVRERVLRGEVCFSYVATSHMVADCLTKPLAPVVFTAARSALGMI